MLLATCGVAFTQTEGGAMKPNAQVAQHKSGEQRTHERVVTALAGKLFVPAEQVTLDCQIINLSGGGAGIQCAEPPPLNTFVVLYIDGFGRFDGVATRYVEGELGLKFVCEGSQTPAPVAGSGQLCR